MRDSNSKMAGSGSQKSFRVTRIQTNMIAKRERQLLTWFCRHLPPFATPDRLTALSVAGALLVFGSDIASRSHPVFLWAAAVGYVVNWFGDSLDGSLARFRSIERPIYGYFLDHNVDALNNLLIMAGLGFTTEVRMDVSLFALVGYYLLCMYVFISNHLSGVFQLSFMGFGPTELRLGLVCVSIAMFFSGHVQMPVAGAFVSIYDAIIFATGLIFVAIFLTRVLIGIRTFRDPARSGAAAP